MVCKQLDNWLWFVNTLYWLYFLNTLHCGMLYIVILVLTEIMSIIPSLKNIPRWSKEGNFLIFTLVTNKGAHSMFSQRKQILTR